MATALARYAISQDTGHNLLALELGNEPNGYLSEADYLARFQRYAAALAADPGTAGALITGPAISENADVTWARDLWARYASSGRMPFTTWHDYANAPNLSTLLQTVKITELNSRIAAMDGAVGAGRHRMDEGADTGKGGLDTVSNVQGTTAWLIDALLRGGASRLRSFHLHSWDGYYYPADNRRSFYTPFVIRSGQASPRPNFYGLALFKYAVGRRFCAVSTSNADRPIALARTTTMACCGRKRNVSSKCWNTGRQRAKPAVGAASLSTTKPPRCGATQYSSRNGIFFVSSDSGGKNSNVSRVNFFASRPSSVVFSGADVFSPSKGTRPGSWCRRRYFSAVSPSELSGAK